MKGLNLKDFESFGEVSFIEKLTRVDYIYLGGKIENKSQVSLLKEKGVAMAIDLKENKETSISDREYFEDLGIDYFNFPIEKVENFDFDLLFEISKILERKNNNIFIYCYSGNRAVLFMALQLFFVGGHSRERILNFASKMGISEGLKEKLKKILK